MAFSHGQIRFHLFDHLNAQKRDPASLFPGRALEINLLARADEKVVFKPLSPDTQREIGRLAVCQELDRLSDRVFNLTVSEAAFEFLVRRGIQKTLGAHSMKKMYRNSSETLSEMHRSRAHDHLVSLLFRPSMTG